jgi:membrane-associated phospholipid phosphatase
MLLDLIRARQFPSSTRRRTRAALAVPWPFGHRQYAAIAGAALSMTAVRARRRIWLAPPFATTCAFALPIVIAAGFPRSRLRDGAVWGAQMWAYKNAFEMPADREERLRLRARFDYPIALDKVLGAGIPPSQRLARRLRRRGRLSVLDKALSFLYWSWEIEPHLVMAWIRWAKPDDFPAAAGRLAATFDTTLVGYWAVPTAPPWWVSEKLGRMDGDIRRVMSEVADWLKGDANPTEGDHEMGANPFAAMPSDHFASAVMTALLLAEQDPWLGAAGWTYALALAFALVYLGEHYVGDLLAGLTLAVSVNTARRPLERGTDALLGLGSSR